MKQQVMILLGALSLGGCGGSGVPWSGGGPDEGPDGPLGVRPGPAVGGSEAGGRSQVGSAAAGPGAGGRSAAAGTGAGGYEAGGTGQGGSDAAGGYEAGGTGQGGSDAAGGYEAGGSDAAGGYEAGGTGQGGYAGIPGGGGTGSGGYTSGGTGSNADTCTQNVTHCFDAAANCYEYSPWSDCDQIVDVCAALQADCRE